MKNFIAVLTMAVLSAGSISVYASPDDHEGRHEERMEKRLEHMTERLNLTKDQQEKIKALFEQHQGERKARRETMRESIHALLTEEQLEKSQQLRKERKGERCERGKEGKGYGRGRES